MSPRSISPMCIRCIIFCRTFYIKGYKQNKCETKIPLNKLRRMLFNALIQSHFDYACSAWYQNLTEKKRKWKLLIQYKLYKQISLTEFSSIYWLPTSERVHQYESAVTFKFVNSNCPFYLNEILEFTPRCKIDIKNSFVRPKPPTIARDRGTYRSLVPLCGTIFPNALQKLLIETR